MEKLWIQQQRTTRLGFIFKYHSQKSLVVSQRTAGVPLVYGNDAWAWNGAWPQCHRLIKASFLFLDGVFEQRVYNIILTPFRIFHTSTSRWFLTGQQVSLSLQDSSQYSGRSQQYCSLDGLHSSSYFQVL